MTITETPTTWKQAKNTTEADQWKKALEDELLAQIKNNTWEIAERPKDRQVIDSRYVFSTKSDGQNLKKKVRLVAKGCSQRPGEDFHGTFSPVVRSTLIRLMAAVAAEYELVIHQMDIVIAYLNGDLEERVFMEVPECLSEILRKISAGKPVGSSGVNVSDSRVINTTKR